MKKLFILLLIAACSSPKPSLLIKTNEEESLISLKEGKDEIFRLEFSNSVIEGENQSQPVILKLPSSEN